VTFLDHAKQGVQSEKVGVHLNALLQRRTATGQLKTALLRQTFVSESAWVAKSARVRPTYRPAWKMCRLNCTDNGHAGE